MEEGKGQRAQDGAYPLAAVAKTGQLRIPVFPCRLGNFEKIDLGTDFEKTAPNTSAFGGVELGIPHLTFLIGNEQAASFQALGDNGLMAAPSASKLPSSSHALNSVRWAGHSGSKIEDQAVSRRRPFTMPSPRHVPS